MPKKSHEHKAQHSHDHSEEGFISNELRRTMNKNEKIIMGILVGGIVIFLALSILVLFGKGKENLVGNLPTSTLGPTKKVNLTPYPTIPVVKDSTVMINSRRFNPATVTIPAGGFIDFLNIDQAAITIEANDGNSSMLNIG